MKKDIIKVFENKSNFKKIMDSYFCKIQPFYREGLHNIKVKYIEYIEDEAIAFFDIADEKITFEKDQAVEIFITSKGDQELLGEFIYVDVKDESRVILKPVEFKLLKIKRKEERIDLLSEKNKDLNLYVANLIADFILKECLADNIKKIDKIKEAIVVKLESVFQFIKVYFINEGKSDRFEYFKDNISPIYLNNITDADKNKEIAFYSYYMDFIYKNDLVLNQNKLLTSEISVPIVYKMKLPYGYIQINNSDELNDKLLVMVKKMATITDQLISKNNIIPNFDDKIKVSDLSRQGIALVFKERKFIKYFKKDCNTYLDLFLPNNIKVNMLVEVKNIFSDKNLIKIGCAIKEIDALSEFYYEEYFNSLLEKNI